MAEVPGDGAAWPLIFDQAVRISAGYVACHEAVAARLPRECTNVCRQDALPNGGYESIQMFGEVVVGETDTVAAAAAACCPSRLRTQ